MLKKSMVNVGLGLAAFCLSTSVMAENYYSYSQAPVPVAVPSPYGPVESGFVVGVGGGYANTHWNNVEFPGSSIRSGGFTGQAFLGYDFNKYFGLQGGYVYLPKAKENEFATKVNNYALDILAKLSLPVTSGFSVYALAGGGYFHSSAFFSEDLITTTSSSRSHFGPAFGVGAQYELVPNLAIGVDWRRYSGQGKLDSNNYQPSPDAVFLNLSYKFPVNIS